jgi:hypothetical protein
VVPPSVPPALRESRASCGVQGGGLPGLTLQKPEKLERNSSGHRRTSGERRRESRAADEAPVGCSFGGEVAERGGHVGERVGAFGPDVGPGRDSRCRLPVGHTVLRRVGPTGSLTYLGPNRPKRPQHPTKEGT